MYVPITRWRKVLSKLVFKQTDSFPRTIRSAGQPGRFEALETRLLLDADAILTHEVTIAKDEDDGNTALHDLSLREALRLASENTDSTLDRIEIHFSPNLFSADSARITLNTNPVNGPTGQLVVHSALSDIHILGPGSSSLTVDADGQSRAFRVNQSTTATIEGLSITGGIHAVSGGGILSSGDKLTLRAVNVHSNTAGWGAGVFAEQNGVLEVIDSEIGMNVATRTGGGIFSKDADLVVHRSSIVQNTATDLGGGGIRAGRNMAITDSTIVGNTAATSNGGGIYLATTATFGGSLNVSNTTLSQNSGGRGGGVYAQIENQETTSLTLTNVTIAKNTASILGGGIYMNRADTVTLRNTIVGTNKRSGNIDDDVFGDFHSASSYNLVGTTSGSTGLDNGVLITGDPRLGPLSDYGGSTKTHALLFDSPAIDAGSSDNSPLRDQRGHDRANVLGQGVEEGAPVDIGSFEAIAPHLDLEPFTNRTGNLVEYREDQGAVILVPDPVLVDADNVDLNSLTISLINSPDGSSEFLSSMGSASISVQNNNSHALTLSAAALSGRASIAEFVDVLRNVIYTNTSQYPGAAIRDVKIVPNDGLYDSNDATVVVVVVPTNDAPHLTSISSNPTYIQDFGFPAVLYAGTNIDLVEATDQVAELRLTVRGLQDGFHERLVIDDTEIPLVNGSTFVGRGYHVKVDAVGPQSVAATITGTIPVLDMESLVNSLAYKNTVPDPRITNRAVYLNLIRDSGGKAFGKKDYRFLSAVSTVTIAPTDVDDFDVSPIIDTNLSSNSVSEDASLGAGVGITAFATDDDITDTVTYSLDNDNDVPFTIHSSTGVVTVDSTLDFDSVLTHDIDVRGTSTDTSFSTKTYKIYILNNDPAVNLGMDGTLVIDDSSTSRDLIVVGSTHLSGERFVTVNGNPLNVKTDQVTAISVFGRDGDDQIDLTQVSGSLFPNLNLGDSPVTIDAGAGDDTVLGSIIADWIEGGPGNDTLTGWLGDDTYAFSGTEDLGSDQLFEESGTSSGIDTLNFSQLDFGVGVDVELLGLSRQVIDNNGSQLALDLSNAELLEQVVGTKYDDRLVGGDGNNRLEGGAGDDVLTGGLGSDTYAFSGSSPLGTDRIVEPASQSTSDTLDFAGLDANAHYNLANANVVETRFGGVRVDLSHLNAVSSGARDTSVLQLDLTNAAGIENVIGTQYDDIIMGSAMGNQLIGNAGDDVIIGDDGNDIIDGGSGNDIGLGKQGRDLNILDQTGAASVEHWNDDFQLPKLQSDILMTGNDRLDLQTYLDHPENWLVATMGLVLPADDPARLIARIPDGTYVFDDPSEQNVLRLDSKHHNQVIIGSHHSVLTTKVPTGPDLFSDTLLTIGDVQAGYEVTVDSILVSGLNLQYSATSVGRVQGVMRTAVTNSVIEWIDIQGPTSSIAGPDDPQDIGAILVVTTTPTSDTVFRDLSLNTTKQSFAEADIENWRLIGSSQLVDDFDAQRARNITAKHNPVKFKQRECGTQWFEDRSSHREPENHWGQLFL